MKTEEQIINQLDEDQQEAVMDHASLYNEIKVLVESMETDVLKSKKGNNAASTRLRKSLRLLKQKSANFVKFTLGKL